MYDIGGIYHQTLSELWNTEKIQDSHLAQNFRITWKHDM